MTRSNPRYPAVFALLALLACISSAEAQSVEETRAALFALESESHRLWLQGDLAALGDLMADEFHFVVMNGAVETKEDVVGTGGTPRPGGGPLQVSRLQVEPERFVLRGNTAIVISLLHIDATARGRALPDRMRILSIFTTTEEETGWRLTARSITPILAPPAVPVEPG